MNRQDAKTAKQDEHVKVRKVHGTCTTTNDVDTLGFSFLIILGVLGVLAVSSPCLRVSVVSVPLFSPE